ncbi:AAA family ATPase [Microbacterium hibisci]|uniref:AAA family ATPase n=1 Tax=Microbacterium hibisci TaxID=2036000 RepID=UPI00194245D3|nr:AAA family ATPase [Microbacterium hibisci]
MLLLVTGASGAGKSTVLAKLTTVDWRQPVVCAEFDAIGVPEGADTAWRHASVEEWVSHAADLQAQGVHLLLFGQVALGELLAAPSTERIDGVAVCLLHCSPDVRSARLRERGEPEETLVHHARFGEWLLEHTRDPAHHPEVIRVVETSARMRWDRWESWSAGDPRWDARIIDTDDVSAVDAADLVEAWARARLARRCRTAG